LQTSQHKNREKAVTIIADLGFVVTFAHSSVDEYYKGLINTKLAKDALAREKNKKIKI